MINIKRIFIILFISKALLTQSQNPGYQGKRFIVGAEISGMPIVGSIFNDEKLFDFNVRYSLKADFVISKSISIGLKLHKAEDIIELNTLSFSQYTPLQSQLNSNLSPSGLTAFKSAANYSFLGYGPFIKIYSQSFGSIAPLGQYFILEYTFGNLRVHDDGRYYNGDQKEIHNQVIQNFVIGTGIQNIFFNHLTFDVSINFGMNLAGAKAVSNTNDYISDGGNYLVKQIEIKNFSDVFLRTQIGLGWLIF